MGLNVFHLIFIFLLVNLLHGQNHHGVQVPVNKGRFPTNSSITQASGLIVDPNGTSLWTHNDQGNPINKIYKFLTTTGNTNVIIEDSIRLAGTKNLDWEDFTYDNSGNVFVCQIGKNCTPNGDPQECPTRFIYKIHKLKADSLNGDTTEFPITYYFKYPLTGYDTNNCSPSDTVFVNSEACIWYQGALYLFTKEIWSKNTNNCGGWVEGFTYIFKLILQAGSSGSNPLIAQYVTKYNLKLTASDPTNLYKLNGAAVSPDNSVLALVTYGRVWTFRNFVGDQFFNATANYFEHSVDGINPITRAYEGIVFKNNSVAQLCVDGVNGRVSEYNLDAITWTVTNTNDAGPGSLRSALMSVSKGDTLRFAANVLADTIRINSGSLSILRDVHIVQTSANPIKIKNEISGSSPLFSIAAGVSCKFHFLELYLGSSANARFIVNAGILELKNLKIQSASTPLSSLVNTGQIFMVGINQIK